MLLVLLFGLFCWCMEGLQDYLAKITYCGFGMVLVWFLFGIRPCKTTHFSVAASTTVSVTILYT